LVAAYAASNGEPKRPASESDRFQCRRIGEHRDADVRALQSLGGCSENRNAPLGELGDGPRRAVPDQELVAGGLEPPRYRSAHPAQSQNSDPHRV
jgi:hypothetical protein